MRLPRQDLIENSKYTTEEVNNMLSVMDPTLVEIVKKQVPAQYRDEVAQDMRIRMWGNILQFYDGRQDLNEFARNIGQVECGWSFRVILATQRKINRKLIFTDNMAAIAHNLHKYHMVRRRFIDMERMKEILSEKEFIILNYMIKTGCVDESFSSLARQLGYHAKGAIRYILDRIYMKIRSVYPDIDSL